MRLVRLPAAAFLVAVVAMLAQAGTSHANFHCMRIHAVLAGFQGDSDIQYVELRMVGTAQNIVGGHVIRFYDGGDVLKATFTFPGNVTSANAGSILIGTSEFNSQTDGGNADFTFTGNTVGSNGGDPDHPVQFPGGRVTFGDEPGDFNCNGNMSLPVDSVAYGTATAVFGSAAVALPDPSDNQALRLNNLNAKPSNNSTEYSLEDVATSSFLVTNLKGDATTPRNNSQFVLEITGPVGGIAGAPGIEAAPAAIEGGGGLGAGAIAAIAGGATAVAVIFVTAGAWYARRRRAAQASWLDEQT